VIFAGIARTSTPLTLGGVFRSMDSGASWSLVSDNSTVAYGVTALVANGADVFAGSFAVGMNQSTDNGTSWTNVGLGGSPINAFLVNGTNLFVATGSGVYVSTDIFLSAGKGTSWMNIGLTGININALAASGMNLFAGTNNGVFLSTNNGISWSNITIGLMDSGVLSLAITGTNLFAGVIGGGVWRRSLLDIIPSGVASEPQTSTHEIQAYPNPFSQSTTIAFASPENGAADVSVVNILGTEVMRIFSGPLDAGEHSFSWDASTLPPGMYECVVSVNGNVQRIPLSHLR
jgi:hypothetical protein